MRRGIIVLALFFAGLGFLQIKQSSIKKLPTPGDSNELFCCYSGVVREGESLYLSFSRLGIPQKIWATVFEKVKGIIEFNRIKPGEEYLLKVSKNGELVYYEHRRSEWETVKIERDSIGIFFICRDTVVFTKVIRCYSGRIKTTLWDAMVSDSIPPGLIDNLIRVFAYNIDFATETRLGDEFSVLYEEDRYDGKAARVGSILAAQYKGKFGTYRAYKYQLPGAGQLYYDEQGRSLKRALLRTPVAFVRISSRFSYSRLHPILGIRRPHLGVDYAAPFGTPVIAAGSGVVTYAGWNGGFGNFVSIQHTGG
ncbi:MAG: peptidoglycan DD-metalloendopeptidase family protein, partial [bacterium]